MSDLPPGALDARSALRRWVSDRRREVSEIRHLVVHRAGGPEWPRLAVPLVTALRPHWPAQRVPYWALVEPRGRVVVTQSLEVIGPHAGKFNRPGLGIAVIGDFTREAPPPTQVQALLQLIQWCCERLELGATAVVGHTELGREATRDPHKHCPGHLLDLDQLRADLQAGRGVPVPAVCDRCGGVLEGLFPSGQTLPCRRGTCS